MIAGFSAQWCAVCPKRVSTDMRTFHEQAQDKSWVWSLQAVGLYYKYWAVVVWLMLCSWRSWPCWIAVWRKLWGCVPPSWPWWEWLALLRCEHDCSGKNSVLLHCTHLSRMSVHQSPLLPSETPAEPFSLVCVESWRLHHPCRTPGVCVSHCKPPTAGHLD